MTGALDVGHKDKPLVRRSGGEHPEADDISANERHIFSIETYIIIV